MRPLLILLSAVALAAAELPLAGTWVGDKPALAADATVVLAMYNRAGTCCGGPAAVLAGLGNLRTSLDQAKRADVRLIAVDVTTGGTAEQAKAMLVQHQLEALPLLIDAERATPKTLKIEIEMTMTYVIAKPDGTRETVFSPAQVRKKLGL